MKRRRLSTREIKITEFCRENKRLPVFNVNRWGPGQYENPLYRRHNSIHLYGTKITLTLLSVCIMHNAKSVEVGVRLSERAPRGSDQTHKRHYMCPLQRFVWTGVKRLRLHPSNAHSYIRSSLRFHSVIRFRKCITMSQNALCSLEKHCCLLPIHRLTANTEHSIDIESELNLQTLY